MIITKMTLGAIQANCFVLGCEKTKKAVVIDPGDEFDRILMSLSKNKLTLEYIINTHGHFDHVGANKKLKDATNAKIMIHYLDSNLLEMSAKNAEAWGIRDPIASKADIELNNNDTIEFGKHKLKVIHTPGHTPGGISIYTEYSDIQGNIQKVVFVGDTLFAGSIGRTDFPGGDLKTLLSSIKDSLFPLGNEVIVYTGHMNSTTIGNEKASNPFCGIHV